MDKFEFRLAQLKIHDALDLSTCLIVLHALETAQDRGQGFGQALLNSPYALCLYTSHITMVINNICILYRAFPYMKNLKRFKNETKKIKNNSFIDGRTFMCWLDNDLIRWRRVQRTSTQGTRARTPASPSAS